MTHCIRAAREAGESLQEIADGLNAKGIVTLRELLWNRVQVSRLLQSRVR